jgi:redox-sensitive bicupin YhaK (pirin superfamily)
MDGRRFEAGKMLILSAAASRVRAVETSTVMVLGGEPVGERFIYWNFVSSSKGPSRASCVGLESRADEATRCRRR